MSTNIISFFFWTGDLCPPSIRHGKIQIQDRPGEAPGIFPEERAPHRPHHPCRSRPHQKSGGAGRENSVTVGQRGADRKADPGNRMSVRMVQAFKKTGLPPTDRLVAFMLADHHNDSTGRCDPSIPLLAEETGLHPRSVERSLADIELAGHVTIIRKPGIRNSYNLHPRHSAAGGTQSPPAEDRGTPGTQPGGPPAQRRDTPGTAPPESERTVSKPERTGRGAPCTEDEAWDYAKNIIIAPRWTKEAVSKWYADRSLRGWKTKGNIRLKPENWMHDMRGAHNWAVDIPRNGSPQQPPKQKFQAG